MKYLLASAIAALGLAAVPETSQAQTDYAILGQILIFAGNFCPSDWHPTDGTLLQIELYQALFSILGTTYGGDGIRTFALPKTQPIYTETRATLTECIALYGIYPSRN